MALGVNVVTQFQRAAAYINKMLKGAKPDDVPVEQVKTFGFVINLKSAKALGIAITKSILVRADKVIE